MARRPVIVTLIVLALVADSLLVSAQNLRPPYNERLFHSPVIDALVANISARMSDPALAEIFANCFPNPLDTTVYFTPNATSPAMPDTFVITGDIPSQWQRDTLWQVFPYLPFAAAEPDGLGLMLRGVVNRLVRNALRDVWANAFNRGPSGSPWNATDETTPPYTPWIWEQKFELDTIASVLFFSASYFNATHDATPFLAAESNWTQAVSAIVTTMRYQQLSTAARLAAGDYLFDRLTTVPTDSLPFSIGAPGAACGLVATAFRPSDDAATFPYNVPANAFAAVALEGLVTLCTQLANTEFERHAAYLSAADACPTELVTSAAELAQEIRAALAKLAVVDVAGFGLVYAYEVDGYGASRLVLDDANVPSLLALPYFGFCARDDPLYERTRAMLHSSVNPYFFKGTAGEGNGSPHTGLGYIWPMAVTMRALTSNSDKEILRALATLKSATVGTGFMHESFNAANATDYTRPWFAWANSLFGALIVHLAETRPSLIFS